MKEYKGIIDKLIKDSYEESLVIDVFNDKIYKYAYVNDDIVKLEELSYADYLNNTNQKFDIIFLFSTGFIYKEKGHNNSS